MDDAAECARRAARRGRRTRTLRATAAGPALANRAAEDPWWGVSTAAGVALGWRDGIAVVAEATPGCAAAIAGARPFLSGRAT
ncbi:hypothetical protein ACE7GA_13405 [Roseomonas sp. CCTCC AB2023176]|uniref:hypothetical protein n=1 Tax=Roseomonas sp. CCTCC AB2023176 TaxID=3342640 RepID=UPI0035E0834F